MNESNEDDGSITSWSKLDIVELNVASRDRDRWKALSRVSAQPAAGGDSQA